MFIIYSDVKGGEAILNFRAAEHNFQSPLIFEIEAPENFLFGRLDFPTEVKGQFSRSLSPLWPIVLFCPSWLVCLRTLPLGTQHTGILK